MKHQATIQPRMETYRTLLKQNTFLSGAAEECLKQLCAPEDQIYVTLWAPALVQYVAWVLEEAQKNRQKRLYFLARDAYPMYLVAKKMVEYLHIPIEICYLRVSRYALRIPEYHLLGDACLDRIFLSGIDISFYQILNRAALSEEEMIAVCREINYQRPLHATLNRKEIFIRHIQLMALGGTIGTGLFLGSGQAIHSAGPAILLAYIITGIVCFWII